MNILCAITGGGDALVPAITGNTWLTIQSYLTTAALCGLVATLALWAALAAWPLIRDIGRKLTSQSVIVRWMMLGWIGEALVCGGTKPGSGNGEQGMGNGEDYAHEDYGHELMGACLTFLPVGSVDEGVDGTIAQTVAVPRTVSVLADASESESSETLALSCVGEDADGTDFATITNWTIRGAFEDWVTIDLPDGFAFPVGLTNLKRVTIMAYGEIRENLKRGGGAHGVSALPFPVSCQPGETTVSYGLTASNTFVIAWSNALSNRVMVASQRGSDVLVASEGTTNSTTDAMGTIASTSDCDTSDCDTSDCATAATNRLNAAIELFPSGAIATTITSDYPSEVPSTYSLVPSPLPEGFYGNGQNEAWIRGNFALFQSLDSSLTNVEQILDVGYDAWLDDWVGVNEQNGHVKATLTIAAVPDNGAPCYLVCGPFKMVVPAAGSYDFPLPVFTDYPTRTYPEAMPLSVTYDEGYEAPSTDAANLILAAVPPPNNTNIVLSKDAEFHITPSTIYVDPTNLTSPTNRVSVWINSSKAANKTYRAYPEQIRLSYIFPTMAEVYTSNMGGWIEFILRDDGIEVTGTLNVVVVPPPDLMHCPYCYNATCPCQGWCVEGCACHQGNYTNSCAYVESQE